VSQLTALEKSEEGRKRVDEVERESENRKREGGQSKTKTKNPFCFSSPFLLLSRLH